VIRLLEKIGQIFGKVAKTLAEPKNAKISISKLKIPTKTMF
jgi:hypothetical protein